MIAIVDYGMGNLRSAQKGFEKAGFDAVITDDPVRIAEADGVVLPGVGAFKDCYEGLAEHGLVGPILEAAASGRPFLGICVGMQLMFEGSEEGLPSPGLGIFPGRVVRFPSARQTGLKVPHMGWNELRVASDMHDPMTECIEPGACVYFVHSYHAAPEDPSIILATSNHGYEFPAMVGRESVYGVQFHPEKSQKQGLAILSAFGRLTQAALQKGRT